MDLIGLQMCTLEALEQFQTLGLWLQKHTLATSNQSPVAMENANRRSGGARMSSDVIERVLSKALVKLSAQDQDSAPDLAQLCARYLSEHRVASCVASEQQIASRLALVCRTWYQVYDERLWRPTADFFERCVNRCLVASNLWTKSQQQGESGSSKVWNILPGAKALWNVNRVELYLCRADPICRKLLERFSDGVRASRPLDDVSAIRALAFIFPSILEDVAPNGALLELQALSLELPLFQGGTGAKHLFEYVAGLPVDDKRLNNALADFFVALAKRWLHFKDNLDTATLSSINSVKDAVSAVPFALRRAIKKRNFGYVEAFCDRLNQTTERLGLDLLDISLAFDMLRCASHVPSVKEFLGQALDNPGIEPCAVGSNSHVHNTIVHVVCYSVDRLLKKGPLENDDLADPHRVADAILWLTLFAGTGRETLAAEIWWRNCIYWGVHRFNDVDESLVTGPQQEYRLRLARSQLLLAAILAHPHPLSSVAHDILKRAIEKQPKIHQI